MLPPYLPSSCLPAASVVCLLYTIQLLLLGFSLSLALASLLGGGVADVESR